MGSPGFRGCARALAAVSACSLAFACADAGPGGAPAAPRRPATSPASPASGFVAPSTHATGYDAEAWVADLRTLTFELASGGRVIMPDCARLRADGSNEVSGLVPDVLLPLAGRDSPHQRAAKVYDGLRAAWPRLGKPVSATAH
jgi:hypothetical protein